MALVGPRPTAGAIGGDVVGRAPCGQAPLSPRRSRRAARGDSQHRRRTDELCRVLRVDVDVALGQVAAPGGGLAVPEVQVDVDEHVGPDEFGRRGLLVERRGCRRPSSAARCRFGCPRAPGRRRRRSTRRRRGSAPSSGRRRTRRPSRGSRRRPLERRSRASARSRAPRTWTSISFVAPSPSRATAFASCGRGGV